MNFNDRLRQLEQDVRKHMADRLPTCTCGGAATATLDEFGHPICSACSMAIPAGSKIDVPAGLRPPE